MAIRIYLESSFISFLTARPSTSVISLARQQFSRDLWDLRDTRYLPVTSALVLDEIARGDPQAAALRVQACKELPLIPISQPARNLALRLIESKAVPATEPEDALHIAVATCAKVDFIASWNFVHLVGPTIKLKLQLRLRAFGFDPPVIATPEEIVEELTSQTKNI